MPHAYPAGVGATRDVVDFRQHQIHTFPMLAPTCPLITCDFPGGNIVVDAIGDDQIDLHQELRGTGQDWFYWCFGIAGAQGRTIRFNFTKSRAIGTRGPAISRDGGATWRWLGAETVEGNSFRHTFGPDERDVRLSFAMPYQISHWQAFAKSRPWLKVASVGRTKAGREVPIATVGAGPAQIFIAARHHCCEMTPNYAIEGLIDHTRTSKLGEIATVSVVPFADPDGVEAGDQGKGRLPRDHGRDYLGESVYPEIAAIRARLDQLKPTVVLDLHCPWIAGKNNENIYLVGCEGDEHAAAQKRFSAMLEAVARGPLPVPASGYLPHGVDWNTGANFALGRGLGRYGWTLPGATLSASIELPYANVGSAEVNADSARAFGEDLARAMEAWVGS